MRVLVYSGTWRSTCYMIFVLKTCGLAKPQNELWCLVVQRKKKQQQDPSKVTCQEEDLYIYSSSSLLLFLMYPIFFILCKPAVLKYHSKVLYLLWPHILAGDLGIGLVGIYNLRMFTFPNYQSQRNKLDEGP